MHEHFVFVGKMCEALRQTQGKQRKSKVYRVNWMSRTRDVTPIKY